MPARRKSKRAKRITGTARLDRQPKRDRADRLTRAVSPPKRLSERAAGEWRALMPAVISLGTISRADLRAFELLAVTLASAAELMETIELEGMTIEAGSGGRKAHPALRAAETARMQAIRLLESFGLTPRGRQSVDVLPPGDSEHPADEFFSRQFDAARKYLT